MYSKYLISQVLLLFAIKLTLLIILVNFIKVNYYLLQTEVWCNTLETQGLQMKLIKNIV
jgi:hypothetical protein